MTAPETVREMIAEYIGTYQFVLKKARPTAGLLGFGAGPKDDPCHAAFLEKLLAYTASLTDIGPEEARETVTLLVDTAQDSQYSECCHWVFVAAQRSILSLLDKLTPEDREQLLARYLKTLPRWKRLPVEKEIIRALKQ